MPAYRDRRSGRWRYRVWVTTLEGRRIRITGTPPTNTKRAAEHAERMHVLRVTNPSAAAAAAPAPPSVPPRKEVPTVQQYSETFLESQESRQKPSAIASKRNVFKSHLLPFFGSMRLDAIDQASIDAWIAKQTCATKTINNRLSALSSMLRHAARAKLIDTPELSFFIKNTKPLTDAEELCTIPDADFRLVLDHAEPRYRVALLLGYQAGLRAGEIRGLQWGDVDEPRNRLTIRRAFDPRGNLTAPKNGKSRRLPLSDELSNDLRRLKRVALWVVPRRDGGPLSYWAMLEAIRALYTKAGVEIPRQPIHALRHSFCSNLATAGTPIHVIKRLAGHSSIQTTLRYMHTNEEAEREALARAFGRQAPTGPGSEVASSIRRFG